MSGASQPLKDKPFEDPKSAQTAVTCLYQVSIAGFWRAVTVVWCNNLMNHSLSIAVEGVEGDSTFYTCKIDVKPWHFWSKKGYKALEVDGGVVDVFWDLRSAKLSGSPEPYADYYVALVCHDEVVLLLGDCKKKAYKKTKSRPSIAEALLVYKKENVFAKRSFSTRARFDERRSEQHCIVVESSTSGPRDPEMWISIDGFVAVHVKNLQWKFRGNETVVVNKQPVQVLWDVHDWLFSGAGTGHGLFIFKPGSPESTSSSRRSDGGSGGSGGGDGDDDGSGGGSWCSRTRSRPSAAPEYCLFLYAWKTE